MDSHVTLRWSFDDRPDRSTTVSAGDDKIVPPSYREREHSNTLGGVIDLSAPNTLEAAPPPADRAGVEAVKPGEETLPGRAAT